MDEKPKVLIVDDSPEYTHIYNALSVGYGVMPSLPKRKPPKVMTKYDHERILKNEIKQAMKANKRLNRRQQ